MTAAKITLAPPEVIAGRYRIEGKLGQGGMGSVWRAQHLTLRSPVAIKLIDPSLADSDYAVKHFMLEAQAAAALRSPHVVQILDHGVDQGLPYIAMELLVGESLGDRLMRDGKLSATDTARVMTHVARAMALAHTARIAHRDLKPENIFLVRNDDEDIAKVLDFGIAKAQTSAFDITTGTRTGSMIGTPHYMSPEQVEGAATIDYRTDLWAMAVIAFECLTGRKPFEGETLGALLLQICSKPIPVPSHVAEVPAGFDEWFAHATQRVPAERFQSARAMADALRAVLTPGAGAQVALSTPPRRAQSMPQTERAAADAGVSASVKRDAAARPDVDEMSDLYPAGVARRGRMALMLIALVCLSLLAAGALLLRRSDGRKLEEEPHIVRPAPERGVTVIPASAGGTAGAAPPTQIVPSPPGSAPGTAAPASPVRVPSAPPTAGPKPPKPKRKKPRWF